MPPQPIKPQNGQESVWEYPRPPRLERTNKRVRVIFQGVVIADTTSAWRFLETSHPPTYYIPPVDVNMEYIQRDKGGSLCEWKGQATYYTVSVGSEKAVRAAWAYHNPSYDFLEIKNYFAFYAEPMDACYVGDEEVIPQPGHFYGGWITSEIVGPFKGEPGSWLW